MVSADGRILHLSGCPYIHDKARLRTVVAREALRKGYAPHVRCLKEYLSTTVFSHPVNAEAENFAGSKNPFLKKNSGLRTSLEFL